MLKVIDSGADQVDPGLTQEPAWPVLRQHLALIHLNGGDPVRPLRSAAAQRELDSAEDVAAVLDWRLDPTGNHHIRGDGPAPWLPALPPVLADDPTWGNYLKSLRQLVSDLSTAVRAEAATWTSSTSPAWARALFGDRVLLADLAVWRAARTVADTDHRSTGPTEFGVSPRKYQIELDVRIRAFLGHDTAPAERWASLGTQIDPRITADPYWPVLAHNLHLADLSGVDIPSLLTAVAAERPLPSHEPAAALWWRIAPHLPESGSPTEGFTDPQPPGGGPRQSAPTDTAQPAREGSRSMPANSATNRTNVCPQTLGGTPFNERTVR